MDEGPTFVSTSQPVPLEGNQGKASSTHQNGISKPVEPIPTFPNDWPNDAGFDVFHEERIPIELTVTGNIPDFAAGTLYRTGPGGYKIETEKGPFSLSHWFDGFSQVHRFQILPAQSGLKVFYNSRHLCDALIERIRKSGKIEGFSFAQKRDPCESLFGKAMSKFTPAPIPEHDPISGRNIGVTLSVNSIAMSKALKTDNDQVPSGHASGIVSLFTKTDASAFQRIDPETLEPLGIARQEMLNPELRGPFSAAHAKSDPVTGDVFNFNLEIGQHTAYRVFRTNAATGETDILATIKNETPAYLHSLLLTSNYVILCIWNSHFTRGGMKIVTERNILDALEDMDPTKTAHWYIVDRRHGKGVVAFYKSDPFVCFHTINAWEEPSTQNSGDVDVVCDLIAYDNMDTIKRVYYDNIRSSSAGAKNYTPGTPLGESVRGYLRRFRLPSISANTVPENKETGASALVDFTAPKSASGELPTINPHYTVTRPHRYYYSVADQGFSTLFDSLLKYDTKTHVCSYWMTKGHTPGEAIFIPDPEGKEEDDGLLLSVVLDGLKGSSYLLCLDARTMVEMGRAEVGRVVGFGFHGVHVKAEKRGTEF